MAPPTRPSLSELILRRYDRRSFLKGGAALAAMPLWSGCGARRALEPGLPVTPGLPVKGGAPDFESLPEGLDDQLHLPPGYQAQVLLRWGDPVVAGSTGLQPGSEDATAQAGAFGYNCDFVAFMPLDEDGSRGVLAVNHENTDASMMWPDEEQGASDRPERMAVEQAAVGHSFVEIRRVEGEGRPRWERVADSPLSRRFDAHTPCEVGGPVRGHPLLHLRSDPQGLRVQGLLQNCSGGTTPWGTVLTGEENVRYHFPGPDALRDQERYAAYGLPGGKWASRWGQVEARFELGQEPNSAHRHGWIVELDPTDPTAAPVKRTALGRFQHEGAGVALNKDGRVVVYMGDDARFEHLYRFVSADVYDPEDRAAALGLLDRGTLSVARFEDDGSLRWLPLEHGQGPLTEEGGFADQGEVLIFARLAARALGATPMDRPEGVVPSPETGRVYAMLTGNSQRTAEQVDGPNPRADNVHGHLLELRPPGTAEAPDHAAEIFTWEVLLLGGGEGGDTRLSCPDNCALDPAGRLWVATDGAPRTTEGALADGLYLVDTEGSSRGGVRRFLRAPAGAEVTGPCFHPDGRSLFLSIQHPGSAEGSSWQAPATRWPDFEEGRPPRPSVVVITRADGGVIGGPA